MGFASDAPAPAPESQEATLALWLAPPRARSEVAREDGNRLAVVDGDRWWSHDPHFGALTNDGDPHHQAGVGEELRALLDPALMIPFVDLEVFGPCRAAGRPAIRAAALPRAGGRDQLGMSLLPQGADEHEIVVDAERGVLLRLESRIEGAPLIVTELLELAFDEDFPADTFTFSSPDGLAPRRFDGMFGAREDLPLHLSSPHHAHGLSITEGTRVFMVSQGLDGAALLDVAASLERASQDPPLLRRAS